MDDRFDLARFVDAQRLTCDAALAELVAGAKRSHWMWFIFPQIAGLGHSAMAVRYAIGSRAEAVAYLAHPTLGPRLIACTEAALRHDDAAAVFGDVDALKFRSSMTLFDAVSPRGLFADALQRFYGGQRDRATLDLLSAG